MSALTLIRAEITKLRGSFYENARLANAARESVIEFERRKQVIAEDIAALEKDLRALQRDEATVA